MTCKDASSAATSAVVLRRQPSMKALRFKPETEPMKTQRLNKEQAPAAFLLGKEKS